MNERPEVKLDQLDTESQNPDSSRAERLRELFPEAVTEGTGDIDFDKLRELLGEHINTGKERYAFTWPGKHEAIRQSQTPSTATLRPLKEKSVDWDTTENLYIEGDNLEVLKLLQRSYHGQVDMIYIDPPYNTGNDFVYRDSFGDTIENYREQTGQEHSSNPETNGRFHSNWLNMMYPRLRLARELLAPTGIMFISIDDNEYKNMRSLCDEIFGEECFIANFVWQRRTSPDMRRTISTAHEYILAFSRIPNSRGSLQQLPLSEQDKEKYKNPDNDPNGPWVSTDCTAQAGHGTSNQFYDLVTPSGRIIKLGAGRCWKFTKEKMNSEIAAGHIWFGEEGNGVPREKNYLKDAKGKNGWTWLPNSVVGHTQEATKELKALFKGELPFDFPKPTRLLRHLLQIGSRKDSLVLDFFSGSATTADAIMQANQKDDGLRRYILVQIPEETTSGYGTLCDIGEERIRRAAQQLKSNTPPANQPTLDEAEPSHFDTGFRVFTLDSSNLKSDEYTPGQELDIDLVKRGRTNEDLLFEVMLRWGLDLSLPVETKECNGYEYLSVAEGELVCCMNDGLTVEVIEHIVNTNDKPRRIFIPDHVFGEQNNLKLNIVDALRHASSEGQEIELRTV